MRLAEVRRNPNIVKRSRTAVTRFCGWDTLLQLVEKCCRETAALIAVIFETGCRVSETLLLRGDMFHVEGDRVNVYGIPVLKKRGMATRNVPIRRDEVLVPIMLEWVEDHPGLLFSDGRGRPRSRQWVWHRIVRADDAWWPHRLRSERATQLVVEYGFNVPMLMRFFNWSRPDEATDYVRLDVEDLWKKMRV